MKVKIAPSWYKYLAEEFEKNYFNDLVCFVKNAYKTSIVYPERGAIFRAFNLSSFEDTKVVIVGQDPYHGARQADGLCFSIQENVPIPPSLKNIFQEIKNEFNNPIPRSGNLGRWAEQGVLLLNATLTVQAHQPGSHQQKGWEVFTDAVIHTIAQEKEHVVFILWGAYAQKKIPLIDADKHLVLKSPHPSPFAANSGFFGNNHFRQANDYLISKGKTAIEW